VGGSLSIGRLALVASMVAALLPACSLGEGSGCFTNSSLDVPGCWAGAFDLQPNFFAAVPTNSSALEIRVQNGIDYDTFSDGMLILVDDIGLVRGDPFPDGTPRPTLLGQPLAVGLSPAVTPTGVPVRAVANPPVVHATLYLNRTCRTQNVALYAMDAVTLEADGTCNYPATGEPPPACGSPELGPDAAVGQSLTAPPALDGGAAAADAAGSDATVSGGAGVGGTSVDGGAQVAATMLPCTACPCPVTEASTTSSSSGAPPPSIGTSVIRFTSLFDGNPAETNARQRLTSADFDLYLADPREICPGGLGPPPRCRGHLQGHFQFYFQRGRPAQPFP